MLSLLSFSGCSWWQWPYHTTDILGAVAVDQDVAEALAVVALCKVSLGFVCFEFYNDVMEDGKGEDSM
jgi:hypothetical protein